MLVLATLWPGWGHAQGPDKVIIGKTNALHIVRAYLHKEFPTTPVKDLEDIREVPPESNIADPQYWCFYFPKRGETRYYVDKRTGLLQANIMREAPTSPPYQMLNNTYSKKTEPTEYFLTIHFDPDLANLKNTHSLTLRLQNDSDGEFSEGKLPERKNIVVLNQLESLLSVTIRLKKDDLKNYKWISAHVTGGNWGSGRTFKIDDIPEEK